MGKRSMSQKHASALVNSPVSRSISAEEEVLVVDARAEMRPADMVERKLVTLLRGVPVPMSHVSAALRKR